MTDEQYELNRQIAEALGWEVREDGAITRYQPPRQRELHPMPNWAGDISKALELVPTKSDGMLDFALEWDSDEAEWVASFEDYHNANELLLNGLFVVSADAPAEAICRAWLAWQERKT